ncbi:MAG: type II secretion system-associated lipoprotein [Leptospira sp.]|nr:type II secretion system-associated lipoprotein [Leptospira sp.]
MGFSIFRRLPAIFLIATFTFLMQNCASRLVPKEKALEYNEIFLERTYILTEELNYSKEESLKKGTQVRVYIESTPSLLKVKCYPIEESREYAIGRMAIYKINDEIEKRELNMEDLEAIIAEKFKIIEPKKKKK